MHISLGLRQLKAQIMIFIVKKGFMILKKEKDFLLEIQKSIITIEL